MGEFLRPFCTTNVYIDKSVSNPSPSKALSTSQSSLGVSCSGKAEPKKRSQPYPTAHQKAAAAPERNKFLDMDSPLLPVPLPAWKATSESVGCSFDLKTQPLAGVDHGYALPDPNTIVSTTNESAKARLCSPTFRPLKPREWRSIVGMGAHPTKAHTLVGNIHSNMADMLKTCLVSGGMEATFDLENLNDVPVSWFGQQLDQHTMPPMSIVQEIMWELFEINFRYELIALDWICYTTGVSKGECEDEVLNLFGHFRLSLIPEHLAWGREGFAHENINERRTGLLGLYTVMEGWNGSRVKMLEDLGAGSGDGLRSGKCYCFPVFPPAHIDLLTLANNAANKMSNPPITLEEDLGPNPLSNAQYEATVGDHEDKYKDAADGEEEILGVDNQVHDNLLKQNLTLNNISFHRMKTQNDLIDLPTSKHVYNLIFAEAQSVEVDNNAGDFNTAKGAHTGEPGKGSKTDKGHTSLYTIPQLKAEFGFKHIQWDGQTPMPIVDSTGQVISCLFGRPNDPAYDQTLESLFDKVVQITDEKGFAQEGDSHRGEKFKAYNCGIAMPMGSLFKTFGLRLHTKYKTALNKTIDHIEELRKEEEQQTGKPLNIKPLKCNFTDSVFLCCTFNFGRNVWTYKHWDFFNWPFGWCFNTALGQFNAMKGGQLVLWELKLIIYFPAGSTVTIPSAVVTHSNIPIPTELQDTDRLRWREMMANKEKAYLQRMELFSTLDELMAIA
ncbi:hypothetical protein V5O48_012818 [Marasmius crinis-equi]|uniref:Uncharacterized protein n=1 Tax=Marasmius crinis-equi TaxID=585013 RepID=A0ABR3F2A9_9AGAR